MSTYRIDQWTWQSPGSSCRRCKLDQLQLITHYAVGRAKAELLAGDLICTSRDLCRHAIATVISPRGHTLIIGRNADVRAFAAFIRECTDALTNHLLR